MPLGVEPSQQISIHALREEGDNSRPDVAVDEVVISIHALREEGDVTLVFFVPRLTLFLSTPSARRATVMPSYSSLWVINFYPRPPRGGRPFQ